MRKKTALRKPSRRKVSRARKESGLIAKKKMLKRSAGTKSALDDRSHRTPKFTCERIKSTRAKRAILSSFVKCNVR